jgi:protease-4
LNASEEAAPAQAEPQASQTEAANPAKDSPQQAEKASQEEKSDAGAEKPKDKEPGKAEDGAAKPDDKAGADNKAKSDQAAKADSKSDSPSDEWLDEDDEDEEDDSPETSAESRKAGESEKQKSAGKADEKKSPAKPEAKSKPATKSETKSNGKPAGKSKESDKDAKKTTVVCLTVKGELAEGPGVAGPFGEAQPTLVGFIQRMDAAAADKDVAAVWLKIDDADLGRGKLCDLRAAIARLRKVGKPVFAELTSATGAQYLLAAACDYVVMPPSGTLIVSGVRAEVTFYKGLLDKLGLEFDSLQMGKYKGAAEPYTRREMSQPLRESLDAIVDDTYNDLVATIAADRRLLDFQVKSLLDQGLFTADTAQKARLIDEVAYADQIEGILKKRLQAESLSIVTNYKRKRVDTDFSGLGGFMKFMEALGGGKRTEEAGKKPKIAVVYAVGPITEGRSASDMFGNSSIGSATMVAALRKAAENSKVAAVVLRIDSPGGSATASDLIWRETVRMEKPLIASMGDVAGSGGYYIAMGAKKIFASPGTLTGSIGVIGGKLVTKGLFDKVGLDTEIIARGANSGSLSSTQPFTPSERQAWTSLLEETYHQFVEKAAQGRKMPYEKLDELAQGRVYTGRMAQRLGLVDELGTLNDAIAAAKVAAGMAADADVDLLLLPEPKSFFEQLFGDPGASSGLDSLLPEFAKTLRQTKILRQILSEPRLLWMPYTIRIE